MSRALAVEIHDVQLVALRDGAAEPLLGGPGFALLEADDVVTGVDAQARARLQPRLVHHRFWETLSRDALGPPFPSDLSAADLAHAHLGALWRQAPPGVRDVLLAVPGWYDDAALGLLLGIATSLEMPVTGLVDSAVAATASAELRNEWTLHVDLHLHRSRLTLVQRGQELVRDALWCGESWGLSEVLDACARRVADVFVKTTRFDPLHGAEGEQTLYELLPRCLQTLGRLHQVELRLPGVGREHAVELRAADVERWLAPQVSELLHQIETLLSGRPSASILLSTSAASVPGLEARLREHAGFDVARLPMTSAVAGVLRERNHVRRPAADGIVFVKRLPVAAAAQPAPVVAPAGPRPEPSHVSPRPSAAPVPAPTHILLGSSVHRISSEPILLGAAPPDGGRGVTLPVPGLAPLECRVFTESGSVVVEDAGGSGCFVDGGRVSGRVVVSAGARLQIGQPGIVLTLVREAEP